MRITGGVHRSRVLVAPRGTETRPTSDRVREALFSILASEGAITGAVLDLYAGTGALGLEALSRGAKHATFVERGRDALAALRSNVQALRFETDVEILGTTVERAARTLAGRAFELVFADPPYALVRSGEAVRALGDLARGGVFAEAARIVLEHAAADSPPKIEDSGLIRDESRRYGDTQLSFYRKAAILGATPR